MAKWTCGWRPDYKRHDLYHFLCDSGIVCGIRPELVAGMRWNKEELISCLVQLIYSNLSFLLAGEEIIQTVECYNLAMLSKRFTKVKPNMKMT